MALNVRDILELPSGQKMNLLAGSGGLGRSVTSVEIADYECAPDVGPDLAGTAFAYVAAGGEIGRAAELICCHANTVRYRLGRIRELTGLGGCTDAELFLQLRLAAAIDQIEKA